MNVNELISMFGGKTQGKEKPNRFKCVARGSVAIKN